MIELTEEERIKSQKTDSVFCGVKPLGQVRWLASDNSSARLQQSFLVTESTDGMTMWQKIEWHDVPTVKDEELKR